MFARGLVSFHTAQLPVPKTLTSKSRISITSKLIETKGFQVHYFGHLRKTGGRGVLLAPPERSRRVIPISISSPLHLTQVEEPLPPTPLFPLHTKIPLVSPFLPLHTRKQGGIPPGKCRRADIFDFSPDFSHFFPIRAAPSLASSAEGGARALARKWDETAIGLFGGGGGELLGGRGESEVDGLKRSILGGNEISKYGEAEPGLRVAEFELGVKGGVWRYEGDQDPLIVLIVMLGW